ncbi:hypothetical protein D3C80_325340 [compost metagenome]
MKRNTTTRKHFQWHWIAVMALAITLASCKHTESEVHTLPETTDIIGAVKPAGEPEGPAVSATIGPQGGTVVSADNRIQLDIPAGALTNETTIIVQPISNTNPAGKGIGYRLTPHGQQFAKPVKITVNYTEEDLLGTIPEALGIAYQDEKGVWQALSGVEMNAAAKKISVTTTHFSDWSFFETLEITPIRVTIGTKESVELKAVRYTKDEWLPSLLPAGGRTPIGENVPINTKSIKNWKLSGGGQLSPQGNTAKYIAPAQIPNPNPVTVSVSLTINNSQVLLFSRITILEEGITFRIDNGPWIHFDKDHTEYNSIGDQIEGQDPALGSIYVDWNTNDPGYYLWRRWIGFPMTIFEYVTPNNHFYTATFLDGPNDNEFDSPGFLSVDKVPNAENDFAIGSFVIEKSGENNGESQLGIHRIEGHFKVKR